MEKVWFKLRQTHYPPEDEAAMGTGRETAPLCLGHFISSLKRLDFVLNGGEIEEFPSNMPVYPTESLHFKWHDADSATTGGGLGGGAPIAALMGLVIKASIQVIFQKSVKNWEEYDRLDTYICQPDKSYVADCLEGEKLGEQVEALKAKVAGGEGEKKKLAKEVEGKKGWSMFMVTGVKVARHGKKTTAVSDKTTVKGQTELEIPTVAFGSANTNVSRGHVQKFGGELKSDFIWAVRLAKVHKGRLMNDWTLDTYTSRATFAAEAEDLDVYHTVAAEGLDRFKVIEDEEAGLAIIDDDDEGQQQHWQRVPFGAAAEEALGLQIGKLMVSEA